MLDRDFWTSDANHVAVNPHRPADALGLSEAAEAQGIAGMCFFQTSGSEGNPKWVALSKAALLISAQAVNAHFEVSVADRWLIALPLYHVGGFAILGRAHVSGSVVIQHDTRWQPQVFSESCSRHGITLVSLVPTQVHDLVRENLSAPDKLRAVIVGGGGMSSELAKAARALGWPVFQSYGMTEAASQIATQPFPSLDASDDDGLMVLPHWRVRTDLTGRLVLRGSALAKCYVRLNSTGVWEWQELGDELVTRDMVELWVSGSRQRLRFVGRESGFVKISGELIHLAPLQARLDALSFAHRLSTPPVIAAMPDERRENRLVLVVESAAAAELLGIFNMDTEPLCQLAEAILISEVPRTPLGKIDLSALQTYLSGTGYARIK